MSAPPPAAQDPLVHAALPQQQQQPQHLEAQTATKGIQGIQDIQDAPASDTDALPEPSADLEAEAEAEAEVEVKDGSSQSEDEEEEEDHGSYYWDASTMAPLNSASAVSAIPRLSCLAAQLTRTQAAVARLRAYKPPPFPLWDRLPVSRRAAVLLLLYADRRGDLRVVITMRAASLRSFSGMPIPSAHTA